MKSFKIDYTCVRGPAKNYFKENGEPAPEGFAMFWCMTATSVWRIFTFEDLKEFLFRLAVSLHSKDIVETWLMKDRLMPYKYKGKSYIFTMEDIAEHFGLEIIDSLENYVEREVWLKNIDLGISNSMLLGILDDFSVISPKKNSKGGYKPTGKEYTPEVTPELIKKAEFFAKDILKFIPESLYIKRHPNIFKKEKEIEERRLKIKNLPVFDIKMIPDEIIKQCLEIMYKEDYVEHLLREPKEFETFGRPLIYLAWLYANDFLEFPDDFDVIPIEGFSLNYEDYEFDDDGINIRETISDYFIEETVPLLKGLLI